MQVSSKLAFLLHPLPAPWRQAARSVRDAAGLWLALYVAAYLVVGGPVLGRLWVDGGHATPEQWAYHALLDTLGFVDHHGAVDTQPAGGDELAKPRLGTVAPLGTQIVVAAASSASALDNLQHLFVAAALTWLAVQSGRRVLPDASAPLQSFAPGPPKQPPRLPR